MLIPDQAVLPLESSPVTILAKTTVQSATVGPPHVLGVCELVKVGPYGSGQGDAFPIINANTYFGASQEKIDSSTATVIILEEADHGDLVYDEITKDVTYHPKDGYFGNDFFALKVEGSGYIVEIRYFMYVTDGAGESMFENKNCQGTTWKISSFTPLLDTNPKGYDWYIYDTPYLNNQFRPAEFATI